MRQFYFVLLLLLGSAVRVDAKVQWLFYAGAGVPYCSASTTNYTDNFHYKSYDDFKVTPVAGVATVVPLGKRFSFEGGVQYTMKGFRGKENGVVNTGVNLVNTQYDSRYRLHYLSLPATLNWKFLTLPHHSFQAGVGITYGFLLRGRWDYYNSNGQDVYGMKNNPIKKGFIQTSNTSNGTFNIFDTGVKLQLSYTWHSRIMLRVFHEQSLYSIYLREPLNRTSVKLRYTGISIGFLLPKAS